jgi:hypothetical protein
MAAALAWFMPEPFGIAFPRGEIKTFICLASDNVLENREFVAISQRLVETDGAAKMLSARTSAKCLQARPIGTTPIVAWHEVPLELDIFLCEFQAPDGRTENSPGLKPWERQAQGDRPERASEWH